MSASARDVIGITEQAKLLLTVVDKEKSTEGLIMGFVAEGGLRPLKLTTSVAVSAAAMTTDCRARIHLS